MPIWKSIKSNLNLNLGPAVTHLSIFIFLAFISSSCPLSQHPEHSMSDRRSRKYFVLFSVKYLRKVSFFKYILNLGFGDGLDAGFSSSSSLSLCVALLPGSTAGKIGAQQQMTKEQGWTFFVCRGLFVY